MLKKYLLKLKHSITNAAFEEMHEGWGGEYHSLKTVKSRVSTLADLPSESHDCCINICVCFAGPYEGDQVCPKCKESRLDDRGKPRAKYHYFPFIPRLQAYYSNASTKELLQYRAQFDSEETYQSDNIRDVFDGSIYRSLLGREVEVDGRKLGVKYFSDAQDIALSMSTDGFSPFDHSSSTTWPIILFNLNLPPEVRVHVEEVLCVGLAPGPRKLKDFDSFLFPLVEELAKLSVGVRTWDAEAAEFFTLRAHLILASGDTPAVSMLMNMKGANGYCPCRMCTATSVSDPATSSTTLYLPLSPSHMHPGKIDYDPLSLPLRSHDSFISQSRLVATAPSRVQRERLARECGIKGESIFYKLPTIEFPLSFPTDFMHLIFENVLQTLVSLFGGDVKGMEQDVFVIPKKKWEDLGRATAACGASIPSCFGSRPPNFVENRQRCTADSWSFWLLYLAPILLDDCLPSAHYRHFVRFSELVGECLQFEMPKERLPGLRRDFAEWVQNFEK